MAANDTAVDKTDVFQFMSLRSPQSVEATKIRHFYIQDDYLSRDDLPIKKLRDVFSMSSGSEIGKIVYKIVFLENDGSTNQQKIEKIVDKVLGLLESKTVVDEIAQPDSPPETLINDLEKYSYYRPDYAFYLLPTKLETIQSEFDIKKLIAAKNVITEHCENFTRKDLFHFIKEIFAVQRLRDIVFNTKPGFYDYKYQQLKIILFETLYTLYILRRKTTVNLEEIIVGLQTLHVLEFLAADEFLHDIYEGILDISSADTQVYLKFLQQIFPELTKVDFQAKSNHFFFIHTKKDLSNFFQATPIIHPIVAELAWYGKGKFNNIKPFLGDLKVVKQWLCGYKVGEISHIHNIMASEEKLREHRHLEKTEEVFSFSSENSQSTQTEQQSTDRFELKREAESVIKTDINVGANANMTYKQGDVFTASVGGNFAYTNSSQDTQRTAATYAQEILNKAVTNIQSRNSQQRSITKLYETEEKNSHKFSNIGKDAKHISGIYRWLDKKYKAQLYNYGQRWMFEFVVPEPAAFYVMSKLKAAEFDINVPQKPTAPAYKSVELMDPFHPGQELFPDAINKQVFHNLSQKYDLGEFFYPNTSFWLPFTEKQKGDNDLTKTLPGNSGDRIWTHTQFKSNIPEGYNVKQIKVEGTVVFYGSAESLNEEFEMNRYRFLLNGELIEEILDNRLEDRKPNFKTINIDKLFNPEIVIPDKEIILDLNVQDLEKFSLSAYLNLDINEEYLLAWKTKLYTKIKSLEQARIDKINQELEIAYNSAMSDYRNKLDDLRAQTVNDIIQGRSEAFNSQIIREELKKHCIAMIAKEFDFDQADDLLSDKKAIEDFSTEITYAKFKVGEDKNNDPFARFEEIKEFVDYPKINIQVAQDKGKFIQFLEQAFEWQQISYIFYPYFWAHESKWIEMINRLDYTDNNMTSFLKAGSTRVLIAVTPGYHNAVMHFLATREPWEGGPAPVIGDPLYIPIYEEIHKQQDDLLNATPEGHSWPFEIPTSLIYLQDSSSLIPEDLRCDEKVKP